MVTDDQYPREDAFKRIVYQNGAILQRRFQNGNSWNYLYFIPDISIREAYLLLNSVLEFEKQYKAGFNNREGLEMYPQKISSEKIELRTTIFEQTQIIMHDRYAVITQAGGN